MQAGRCRIGSVTPVGQMNLNLIQYQYVGTEAHKVVFSL